LYRVPYINKKQKQGLVFEMDYLESKNVADSTINHKLDFFEYNKILRRTKGIGLTYTYRNNFYNQHKIKYEVRQTNILDTLYDLNPNYLGTDRTRQTFDAITYEFVSDHRDVAAYPLRGNILTLNIEKYGVGLHRDLNKTEGFVSFAGFKDLKKAFSSQIFSFLYRARQTTFPTSITEQWV
jgi:hypothetical protein